MKLRYSLVPCLLVAIAALQGCSGDTSVSRNPSKEEIAASVNQQAANVDKLDVSDDVKRQMKEHYQNGPGGGSTVGARK